MQSRNDGLPISESKERKELKKQQQKQAIKYLKIKRHAQILQFAEDNLLHTFV